MNITTGKYVEVHYTVSDTEGNVLDTSEGASPLGYIHGVGQMIPGFEKAIEGLTSGAELGFPVAAAEAYGLRDDSLVKQAARDLFPAEIALEEGMQFEAQFPDGPRVVTITEVAANEVTLDANHPLAGRDLRFNVRIMSVEDTE